MLGNARGHNGHQAALPLVLLPGTLCDARVFGPLRERLQGIDIQVIPIAEAASLREAAGRVLAVAPQHFALLGFSLGGLVAMEMALCAPNRVHGLALISTTPLPIPPELHDARRADVAEARRVGTARLLRERLWPHYCGLADSNAPLPLLVDMAAALGPVVFAQQTEMALARADFRPRLQAVECPVLVLAGTEDKVCPPSAQRELVAALPRCRYVTLPGAGHLAVLERPDEVASPVAAWFHTVERSERPAGYTAAEVTWKGNE